MSDTIGINVTATDAGFSATFDKMQAKVNEFAAQAAASAAVQKAQGKPALNLRLT